MNYTVTWKSKSGYIGSISSVRVGTIIGSLEETIANVLEKAEGIPVSIVKIKKKKSSGSSFGVGIPQSKRDR